MVAARWRTHLVESMTTVIDHDCACDFQVKFGRPSNVSRPPLAATCLLLVALCTADSIPVPLYHGCVDANSSGLPYCNSKLSHEERFVLSQLHAIFLYKNIVF